MTDNKKRPDQTLIFHRNLTCLEYKTNHGAPIYHAETRDLNSDLLIKVFDRNGKLQGCIPCDKGLIIKHSLKIVESSAWINEEENETSIFELKTDIKPDLVCDFIKTLYSSGALIGEFANKWTT